MKNHKIVKEKKKHNAPIFKRKKKHGYPRLIFAVVGSRSDSMKCVMLFIEQVPVTVKILLLQV